LARLLVDVRAAVHGELLDTRRQRNGAPDERAGTSRGVRDLAGRLIEHAVIEGLKANTDILSFHVLLPMRKSQADPRPAKKQETAPPHQPCDASAWEGAAPREFRPVESRRTLPARRLYYFVILLTTPEPTVRPPSRMAKRRPSSIAIGAISLTPIVTLSPGMTISVPSGRITSPVTSVVRK